LALAYLLPTISIAAFFGNTLAVASSFASGFAAAYFIFPPKFSLYIADPRYVAELGFILLLAVTAGKAVGVLTEPRSPSWIFSKKERWPWKRFGRSTRLKNAIEIRDRARHRNSSTTCCYSTASQPSSRAS